MKTKERPLAYLKAQELSYDELAIVTGGANKGTFKIDRTMTNMPTNPDQLVEIISD